VSDRVAVLASGGLDSAVLVAGMAKHAVVYPIYVAKGLAWERQELAALRRFLAALDGRNVQPVTVLRVPVKNIYGEHWSVTGRGVPAADAPDVKVFLPGRNILLIALAAVWCSVHDVHRIALGSLGGNPFPDATPEFFSEMARLVSQGLGFAVTVEAPYRGLHKDDLIRRAEHLPLELTLTCMAPRGGKHCGACNKCYERQQAFVRAEVEDRTRYAERMQVLGAATRTRRKVRGDSTLRSR